MDTRTFQNRLGAKQDIIRRKLIDNNIQIVGSAVDTIRVSTTRNDEMDIMSSKIIRADVVSIDFPPLVDVPFRWIEKDADNGYRITSLVNNFDEEEEKKNYEITVTHGAKLDMDDLIFRVFIDPDVNKATVLPLQIAEQLGTFGFGMIILNKYHATIYTENLPKKIEEVVIELAKRRLNLKF